MSIDLQNITIKSAHASLKSGEFSVRDLVDAYLENINSKNKDINAYIEIYSDLDGQVEFAQSKFADGTATELTGIPFGMKDNILIKGKIASSASNILKNYTAVYDSTVTKKLKESGVIFLGRTNMDDAAMGSSTETSCYGPTKNPLDTDRVPGGSSGGSASAVAMNGALVALGSDTGGSIRQPASYCGLVGLKPTYGSVSRYGLIAMASSLDVIGPLTKSVEDSKIVYDAIKGQDAMDSTSMPEDKISSVSGEVKKIGVPRDFVNMEGVDSEVKKNFEETLEKLKDKGYEIVDISIPDIESSLAVYYILMPAEASTNLSRLDGIRFGLSVQGENVDDSYKKTRAQGFGKEVKKRILLGTYVLSHGYYDAYYNKAQKVRTKITQGLKKVFEEVDVVMTPATPSPAFKFGEKSDPIQMYLSDIFTVPANIAGIPAISIPKGTHSNGLPLDVQIMATHFAEEKLFTLGKDIESL
ncbi:MAG: aspartyl-tRNA(Asn)/glutamyl-tRNA(Gln) amidotransferase subunit A [Candidatus Paceibacteria bacterium]|jgi:aspartyl-tRNA(Asn)/glutamyl-tRNA(Gln) amidotransferase subunit A